MTFLAEIPEVEMLSLSLLCFLDFEVTIVMYKSLRVFLSLSFQRRNSVQLDDTSSRNEKTTTLGASLYCISVQGVRVEHLKCVEVGFDP